MIFVNTMIIELDIFKGKFNPFPYFDYERVFKNGLSKDAYMNMVVWQIRWVLLSWLITQLTNDKIIKIPFTILWVFFTFNLAEFFINYQQSSWLYRVGFLLISSIITIFYYGRKKE